MIRRPRAYVAAAMLAACVAGSVAAQQMPSRTTLGPAPMEFAMRGPQHEAVTIAAQPEAKAAAPAPDARGTRVGSLRAAGAPSGAAGWIAVPGGWVMRYAVSSPGAVALRARLTLPAGLANAEVVARGTQGADAGLVADGVEAWTPLTRGDRQEIEVFAAAPPASLPVVEAIVHFDVLPTAKATAGACSPDVVCSAGDAALDAAIAERRNSVVLLSFVEGTEARACSGTLINTEKFPTAFVVTANHCIATAAAAASVTTLWFNEAATCGGAELNPAQRQVAGGATLVFTSYGPDSTLLQLKTSPPPGAVYAGWNAARLAAGDSIVSISHPQGGPKKFALGTNKTELQVRNYPQDMYGVAFSRGVTEGGSSGSGVFTLAGGSLQLRGVLSGSTLRTGNVLSCENADVEEALYGRFEIFHPQIADYIAATPPVRTDDYGNRITEAQRIFPVAQAIPSEVAYPGRIDYAGDVDVFRVDIPTAGGTLTVRTDGGVDTIGTLLDSAGRALKSVNDAEAEKPDFGLTRTLAAGTYYVAISHREAAGTGAYTLKSSISTVDANYTDLWWDPAEPGWGINVNHQGWTLFVTVFVYDAEGKPQWLVAPNMTRQSGVWQGSLLVAAGPPFNAETWTPATTEAAGTIRLTFTAANKAQLSYTAFGRASTRNIERQVFSVPPVCRWSSFNRSFTTNFQDLWWNPAEPGWGLNIAHQGGILFATLFTYDEAGKPLWLVMSRGERISDGSYLGELYRTATVPGAASPIPVTTTVVGTFSVLFTRGHEGSIAYTYNGVPVVKRIQRQVYSMPTTECFAPGNE